MNKPIPDGGRSVKCARCAHQWRIVPEEPEELTEAFEAEDSAAAPGGEGEQYAAAHDTAAGSAPGFHEPQTGFPAHPAASSWEARRGNLAAAIAAMSDGTPAETSEHQAGNGQEDAAFAQGWTSDTAESDASADEPRATGSALFSGMGETAADEDEPISSPPAWLRNTSWDEPRKAADEIDPEQSVRQVLQAAFDDPDDAREDAVKAGDSTLSRPVFAASAAEDTSAVVSKEGAAALANAFGDAAVPADDDAYAAAQKGLAARWDAFGSQPAAAGEPAATAFSADGDEASEKFENDIAGIFRQEMQAKRSFGHSATKRSSQTGFTDYDVEAGSASEAADDRYMADSPLDADAAALQAALEGSLREKHPAEARNGSGGLALAAAWAVFICVLSGVATAFVSFRDQIVVALPGTASLYRGVGLGVQDQQIDFGAVNYRWTVADGKPMIEVTGQIINLTDSEITVPRVLINVHDKENTDTVKATATLRSEPLAAREAADFTLEFISPSKTISQIELAFAERTE
jgi:hypothetical protein